MDDPKDQHTVSDSTDTKKQPPPPPSTATQSSVVGKPTPLSSGIGRAKTELPQLPDTTYTVPRHTKDNEPIVGNKSYELSLRMDGRLGFCKSRANAARPEVNVSLNVEPYTMAITDVLRHVLTDLARLKKDLSDTEITSRVEDVSRVLTRGVLVMTYLKLRALNLYRPNEQEKFCSKPKVPDHFEVPTPFGFAISQLGIVEVSSLPKRKICYPTTDSAAAGNYLLTRKNDWSQTAYAEAVRYAKSLGMCFTTVDLDIKVGSSWWLFQPKMEDGLYSLRCLLPEDNYTLAGAVVYMLFCNDATSDPATEIFNLASIPDADYGSFIRGPRDGFNYAAYYAIAKDEGSEEFWKSAA